jgi:hypothetical protein
MVLQPDVGVLTAAWKLICWGVLDDSSLAGTHLLELFVLCVCGNEALVLRDGLYNESATSKSCVTGLGSDRESRRVAAAVDSGLLTLLGAEETHTAAHGCPPCRTGWPVGAASWGQIK